MNGKDRVKTALKHQEPDRVPISCQYTPEIQRLLEDYTGQKGIDVNVAMGDDAVIVWEGMVNLLMERLKKGRSMTLNGEFDF